MILISIALKTRTILKNSILVILLLLAGCAVKRFQPAAGDYLIEDRFAIVRTDSLIVAIRPQAYRSPNGTLNDKSFSLYLRVQNISQKSITLPENIFPVLVNGRQFSPFPHQWMMISTKQPTYWSWQDPLNPVQEQEKTWLQREEDRYDMMADAFNFGEILSGARKEGFLFYQDDISYADSIAVDVFGQRVGFIRR